MMIERIVMNNLIKTQILVSLLRVGDTVELNNQLLTVGKNDVKKGFLGYAFRGDASKRYITRVQFKVPTNNGIKYR